MSHNIALARDAAAPFPIAAAKRVFTLPATGDFAKIQTGIPVTVSNKANN
jgi:hypothetical protein